MSHLDGKDGVDLASLKRGQYRVVFLGPRSKKEMVGRYMGQGGPSGRDLLFDMRPLGGTVTLKQENVLEIWATTAKKRLAGPCTTCSETRIY